MKIGILSMQKILNYGSFLQAFSLKKQFEDRGHEVYFIDIEQGKEICRLESEASSLLSKFDRYFFKRVENYLMEKKMTKIHTADFEHFLETEKHLDAGEHFDLVLIGSDEVFNATAPSRWGFTTQLFGNIDNADRIVTYAASCGSTTLESAKKYGIETEIDSAMKKICRLSVRDRNTYDFVEGITGRKAEINIDPVFLANYDPYIKLPNVRKPYLLVYAYANRIHDSSEISAIKSYAKRKGLNILSVGMQQRWCDHNITANAFELLGYVKNATCIVTDTFHGTVFSIKYNKKFVSLIRESNKQKLGGLLKQFKLYDRAVFDMNNLDAVLNQEIDYSQINEVITEEQEKSKRYLDLVCGN